jgi:hypothetical protein
VEVLHKNNDILRKEKIMQKNNLNNIILKTYLISIIFFLFLLSSCLSLKGVSEETKQNLREKDYPIAIIGYRTGVPNSVGGVNAYITWQNISLKEIKYIVFSVTPYNRVNDIVSCEISRKTTAKLSGTGPIKPNAIIGAYNYWENVWYNSTIGYITIDNVKVTFMNGTIVEYNAEQISNMIVN